MTKRIVPIYLKFEENEVLPKTINQLLKKFFSSQYGNQVRNIQTFSARNCERSQCVANKYRSFDDVFRLVNTYFKETPKETAMKALLKVKIENVNGLKCNLQMDYCCTMRKVRLWFTPLSVNQYHTVIRMPKGISAYTWKELLDSIGIDSQEKLAKYQVVNPSSPVSSMWSAFN